MKPRDTPGYVSHVVENHLRLGLGSSLIDHYVKMLFIMMMTTGMLDQRIGRGNRSGLGGNDDHDFMNGMGKRKHLAGSARRGIDEYYVDRLSKAARNNRSDESDRAALSFPSTRMPRPAGRMKNPSGPGNDHFIERLIAPDHIQQIAMGAEYPA